MTISLPRRVHGILSDVRIASISCGKFHSLALSDSGQLYSWGDNRFYRTLFLIIEIYMTRVYLFYIRCGQMGISSKTITPDFLMEPLMSEQTTLVVKSDKDSSEKTCIGPLIRRLSGNLISQHYPVSRKTFADNLYTCITLIYYISIYII